MILESIMNVKYLFIGSGVSNLAAVNYLLDIGQKDICEGSAITQATLSRILNYSDRKPTQLTEAKVKRYLAKKGYEWK